MKKILAAFFGILLAIVFAMVNGFTGSELLTSYPAGTVLSSIFFPLAIVFFALWWFMPSKRVTLVLATTYSLPMPFAISFGFWPNIAEPYNVFVWLGCLLILTAISDVLITRSRRKISSDKVNFTQATS
jgi:hypothetical protein